MVEKREIGKTGIFVTPVAMGCWPIAGITSLDVSESQSLATLEAAFDSGVNFFDTAYAYGYEGESERMIAKALGSKREQIVIATKGGVHWEQPGRQGRDGTPETLRKECEESLTRLETDFVDLLYLHAPDPRTPIADSAGELKRLLDEGKCRSVGVSNFDVQQLEEFARECPLSAFQPHYNMLQREIEQAEAPWCQRNDVSVMVYWPLLKGLLAGKLARDHEFDPRDGRTKYPMFQGEEWHKNQDLIDRLRPIAEEAGKTLAQLVVNWTISQPGIAVALCGAKRPEQIRDNAGAMGWTLTAEQTQRIDEALKERGRPASQAAV